jgi:sortase A
MTEAKQRVTMRKKKLIVCLIMASVISGSLMVARSGYFYAKGFLAQHLLNSAWELSKRSGRFVKPWSWADTWPVARLTIHSVGLSEVVLNNASRKSLSLGPAHVPVSAPPGSNGNIAIAGHRDSFFRTLEQVKKGDVIELESLSSVQYFRVNDMEIADPEDTHWVEKRNDDAITLVTCYPFDYIGPAPERYVVRGTLLKTGGH